MDAQFHMPCDCGFVCLYSMYGLDDMNNAGWASRVISMMKMQYPARYIFICHLFEWIIIHEMR